MKSMLFLLLLLGLSNLAFTQNVEYFHGVPRENQTNTLIHTYALGDSLYFVHSIPHRISRPGYGIGVYSNPYAIASFKKVLDQTNKLGYRIFDLFKLRECHYAFGLNGSYEFCVIRIDSNGNTDIYLTKTDNVVPYKEFFTFKEDEPPASYGAIGDTLFMCYPDLGNNSVRSIAFNLSQKTFLNYNFAALSHRVNSRIVGFQSIANVLAISSYDIDVKSKRNKLDSKVTLINLEKDSILAVIEGRISEANYYKQDTFWFMRNALSGTYAPGLTRLDAQTGVPECDLNHFTNGISKGLRNPNNPFRKNSAIQATALDANGALYVCAETDPIIVRKLEKGINLDTNFIYNDTSSTSKISKLLVIGDMLWMVGRFDVINFGLDSLLKVVDKNSGKTKQALISTTGVATDILDDKNFVYVTGNFKVKRNGKTFTNHVRIHKKTFEIDTSWAIPNISSYARIYIKDSIILFNGYTAFNTITRKAVSTSVPLTDQKIRMWEVGNDTLIYATNFGVYRYLYSTQRFDTVFHQSKILVSDALLKGDTLFIAYYATGAELQCEMAAWYLPTLKPLNYLVKFNQIINNLTDLGKYISVSGSFTSSHLIQNNNHAGYLTTNTDVLRGITLKDDTIPEWYSFEVHHRLKSSNVMYEFPINYKDSFYLKKKDIASGFTTITAIGKLTSSSYKTWIPYKVNSFDVDGDFLYALREIQDTIDVFDLSNISQSHKLVKQSSYSNYGSRKLIVENGELLISCVQNDIDVNYNSPISSVDLQSNIPFHINNNILFDEVSKVVKLDNMLYVLCALKKDKLIVQYNLSSGKSSLLFDLDDRNTSTYFYIVDSFLYFYNWSNGLCKLNVYAPQNPILNITMYHGKVVKDKLYTVTSNSSWTELSRIDLTTKKLTYLFRLASNEQLINSYDNIYISNNGNIGFFTLNTGNGNRIYRLITANGILLIQRNLPRIMLNSGLNIQQVEDYLVFKALNPSPYPPRAMGFHLNSGLIDSNFIYWDDNSDVFYFFQEAGDSFDAIGLGANRLTFKNGGYGYEDGVFSRYRFRPQQEITYLEHSPRVAGAAPVRIKISTTYMPSSAHFYFVKGTDTVFTNRGEVVNKQGAELTCLVDFTGRSGSFDLIIETMKDSFILVPNALEVVAPTVPHFDITMNCPNYIRLNSYNAGHIEITNNGNTDARLVPLLIHSGAELNITLTSLVVLDSTLKPQSFSDYHVGSYPNVGDRNILVLIPEIGANSTVKLDIHLTSNTEGTYPFTIRVGKPFLSSITDSWDSSGFRAIQHYLSCKNLGDSIQQEVCFDDIYTDRLAATLTALNGSFWLTEGDFLTDPNRLPQSNITHLISLLQYNQDYVKCVKKSKTDWYFLGKQVTQAFISTCLNENASATCKLIDANGNTYTIDDSLNGYLTVINSLDPNVKIGPLGAFGSNYVQELPKEISFQIQFENDKDASAPAQRIVITDTLDVKAFDLKTIQFNRIRLGNQSYLISDNNDKLNLQIPLINEIDVHLKATSTLDSSTGVLRIVLQGVGAETGDSNDLLANQGILPPNVMNNQGIGSVDFTVKLLDKVGKYEINNLAVIKFDFNQAIKTNRWEMVRDTMPPQSSVRPITVGNDAFTEVRWTGSDMPSGIQYYDIYKSENNGPFTLWLSKTNMFSGTINTDCDVRYDFYSIAYDLVGNQEKKIPQSEASFTANCGLRNQLKSSLEIAGMNAKGVSSYVGEKDYKAYYVATFGITSKSDSTYWAKDINVDLKITPVQQQQTQVDSIKINESVYSIGKTIDYEPLELLRIPSGNGVVVFQAKLTDSSLHLDSYALDSAMGSYIADDSVGIVTVNAKNPANITWYLSRGIDWTLPHLTDYTLHGNGNLDGFSFTNATTGKVTMDKQPPRTIVSLSESGSSNDIAITWHAVDTHAGVANSLISLYRDGSLLFTADKPSTDTVFYLTINPSNTYHFSALSTDRVGNIEKADEWNTVSDISKRLWVNEPQWSAFRIIPNPSDQFISLCPSSSKGSYNIFSATGEMVASADNNYSGKIFIGNLTEGWYLFEFHLDDMTFRTPLIISR